MVSGNEHHTALLVRRVLDLFHKGLHSDVRNIVSTTILAIIIYTIIIGTYRLTLHPLAKYPGPFLRKISQWPDALSAHYGRKHLDIFSLHLQYGDIVRIGPNSLSFKSSEAFKQLYGDRNANVIKAGPMGFGRDTVPVPSMITMEDKQEHGQRRRLVAHAFSEKALAGSENLMIEKIDEWTDVLSPDKENAWSTPKNMSDWCNMLALDVISKLCFGQDYGAIKAGHTPVHPLLIEQAKLTQTCGFNPLQPLLKAFFRNVALTKIVTPGMYRRRWGFRLLTLDMLKKRNQTEIEADETGEDTIHDFFHYIFKAKDPITGERPPFEQFQSEASLLVAAGSDTTSTALASLMFYLNSYPKALAKLNAEIRSTFTDINEIRTGPQLNSLHYLRACIDEALRMNPPVPSGLSREVLHNGMTLENEFVPEGTVVVVTPYTLHRNETYFPEPHKYIPERWLAGSKTATFEVNDDLLKREHEAFNPFSAGIRNCVGKNMAYQEMTIAMARLLFLYDMRFSTAPGAITGGGSPENIIPGLESSSDFCYEDYLITTKKGPVLEFKKREMVN